MLELLKDLLYRLAHARVGVWAPEQRTQVRLRRGTRRGHARLTVRREHVTWIRRPPRRWRRAGSSGTCAPLTRSDLVERVRYPNPLPELPYAPKLVHIPAPQANYASPVYAQRIAESQQLPVAVDAEAGMPLDLARMESLWLADARGAVTTSYPLDEAQLHDDDAFLLSDDVAARAPGVNAAAAGLKARAVALIFDAGFAAGLAFFASSFFGGRFRSGMSSGTGVVRRNDCAHALRSVSRFCFSFWASSALPV